MDPALALHRLDQDRPGVRPDGRRERVDVVQLREAHGRRERLERRPLAGWPVAASAPCVRPWKEPSSATTTGFPVALRAHFSAASIASGAGVAEERARAAEAVGEQLGEPEHRLGRVEVGGVPERVELCVRGGERRRVAVPERDDRDPGEQVEVALAVGVGQPDAVAGDEGDVVPRVGRQQRRGRQQRAHATTAVAPIVASTPPRVGDDRGLQLRARSRRRARRRRAGARPPRRGSSRRPRRRAAGRERR